MRITSALFVAALIRQCQVDGVVAVVMRRGAESAGAIFIVVDRLDGTADLYCPAPQTAFDATPSERLFQRVLMAKTSPEIDARLAKERRFDPDCWVVAVEDRAGRAFVPTVAP